MKPSGIAVSEFDNQCYIWLRENISRFLRASAAEYDREDLLLLNIAPKSMKELKLTSRRQELKHFTPISLQKQPTSQTSQDPTNLYQAKGTI